MKALLVYPKTPITFWGQESILWYIKKKAAYPPLGMLTFAAMLPKEWEINFVDENVKQLTDEDISQADMVFVGGIIIHRERAKEVIDRCKNLGKTVVAGGALFDAYYNEFKRVDHFILGEAEDTLPKFLRDLKNGEPKKIYHPRYKKDKVWPTLINTPSPRWDLINPNDYATMSLQFSRGCPFNCEFCDITATLGKKQRFKDIDQVINELNILRDLGWTGAVFFVDDNFIGKKAKAKELLLRLAAWQKKNGYPFDFITQTSINLAVENELKRLMAAANFVRVFIGFETPEEASLEECGKKQNIGISMIEAVKSIHVYGIQVAGGFIVGFDKDPPDIFEKQIKLIQQAGIVIAMVGMLTAIPGTLLYERLKKENRLLRDTSGVNTDGNLNFIPIMGRETLIEGYKKIIATIYSPEGYYKRIEQFVRDYKAVARGRFSWVRLGAFFKSMWRIGILSKEKRFLYWPLLFYILRVNIRSFPEAVAQIIYGEHFIKEAKKLLLDFK